MQADGEADYDCPVCGEEIVIPIDPTEGEAQSYVEDCPVCCAPIVLSLNLEHDGTFSVRAERE